MESMKKRDGRRRKVTTTGMDGKQGEVEDAGRKGARAKKRSMDEKASKKCSNMAKRAQIASLAISRGGQKDYICDGRNIWSREV